MIKNDDVLTALLLVEEIDFDKAEKWIASLNNTQKLELFNWCANEHFYASDNDDAATRTKKPDFLEQLQSKGES